MAKLVLPSAADSVLRWKKGSKGNKYSPWDLGSYAPREENMDSVIRMCGMSMDGSDGHSLLSHRKSCRDSHRMYGLIDGSYGGCSLWGLSDVGGGSGAAPRGRLQIVFVKDSVSSDYAGRHVSVITGHYTGHHRVQGSRGS